jgi:hypothetical protein
MRAPELVGPIPDEYLPPLAVSVKTARRLLGIGNNQMWRLIMEGRVQTVTFSTNRKRFVIYSSLESLIKEAADRHTLGGILNA